MNGLVIIFSIFTPLFLIIFFWSNRVRLEDIIFSIFIIFAFFLYLVYIPLLMVYMYIITFKMRSWFNDDEKLFTLKLYYGEYVVFFEYWYYLMLYITSFVSSIFYATLYYLYYILFLRLIYNIGGVHIYYFIIEYNKL